MPRGGPGSVSFKAAALSVLEAEGRSMTAKELWAACSKRGLLHSKGASPHQTISGALTNDVKERGEESRFRFGNGVFWLAEWREGERASKGGEQGKPVKMPLAIAIPRTPAPVRLGHRSLTLTVPPPAEQPDEDEEEEEEQPGSTVSSPTPKALPTKPAHRRGVSWDSNQSGAGSRAPLLYSPQLVAPCSARKRRSGCIANASEADAESPAKALRASWSGPFADPSMAKDAVAACMREAQSAAEAAAAAAEAAESLTTASFGGGFHAEPEGDEIEEDCSISPRAAGLSAMSTEADAAFLAAAHAAQRAAAAARKAAAAAAAAGRRRDDLRVAMTSDRMLHLPPAGDAADLMEVDAVAAERPGVYDSEGEESDWSDLFEENELECGGARQAAETPPPGFFVHNHGMRAVSAAA